MSIFTYLNPTEIFNLGKTRVHCVAAWQVWVHLLEEGEYLITFPTHRFSQF